MPQLIVAALVQAGVSAAAATVAAYAVTIGASVAISDSQRRKAQRKARDAYNASLRDRIVNVRSAVAPRELVVGKVRKGGPVMFFGSTGVHKEKFSVVIAMAAHEIDGVEAVWLNDERQTLDASGFVVGGSYSKTLRHSESEVVPVLAPGESTTITLPHDPVDSNVLSLNHLGISTSGRVVTVTNVFDNYPRGGRVQYQWDEAQPKARIRWHKGAGVDALHGEISALFPAEWTAAHKLEGIAYALAEFDYDEEIYASGPPTVSFLLRGDPNVEDPRTGTIGYTENPALLVRHVAMHSLGARLPATAVSTPHCIAAANECDTSVTYTVGGIDEVRPLYTAGLVHVCGTRPADTISELIEAMAGAVGYTGGGIIMRAGTYTPPVFNITERHMLSGLEIQPEPLRDETYNMVTGTFVDSANGWSEVDMPAVEAEEWIPADGEELPLEVEYAGIFHVGQAQHVSAVKLRDSRQGLTVKGTFDLPVFPVELLDTVSITSARRGWAAKPFLVLHRAWNVSGKIDLVLKETGSSIYAMDGSFSAVDAEPNTSMPSPLNIERPVLGTIESGTDQLLLQADGTVLTRVLVPWTAASDQTVRMGGRVEVAYTRADEPLPVGEWPSASAPGDASQIHLQGLQDGARYVIKARFINAIARGPWSLQAVHDVVGKTEPPPNVVSFDVRPQPDGTRQLSWSWGSTPPPADLRGYLIRYRQGAGPFTWEEMLPFDTATGSSPQNPTGFYTTSPIETNALLAGNYQFAIKTQDTSLNEAVTALIYDAELPDPRLGNSLLVVDYAALNWPGTLTDCVRDTEEGRPVLHARDQATWDDLPTWDQWTRWIWDPLPAFVYETPAEDFGIPVRVLPVAQYSIEGDVTIEESHCDDGVTWSPWAVLGGAIQARYFKLRVSVAVPAGSPSGPGLTPVCIARGLQVHFIGNVTSEVLEDLDPSTLTGANRIGAGDIRLPLTKNWVRITRLSLSFQNVTENWSWSRRDKDTAPIPPRVQLFDASSTLADPPLIDVVVEGIAS